MMHQPERWLMLLAVLLYFFDAYRLLDRTECLVRLDRHGWAAHFGMRDWTIARKEPLLPNPFTGHRPGYLIKWQLFEDAAAPALITRLDQDLRFSPLGSCAAVSAVCLFIVLPLGLFTRAGSIMTVAAALLITCNNLVAMAVVYRRRHDLRISTAKWLNLSVECLLCPPFSLNLIRKLCALQQVNEPLEAISARLFSRADQALVRDQCVLRIDDALASLPADSVDEAGLREVRARFLASAGSPVRDDIFKELIDP